MTTPQDVLFRQLFSDPRRAGGLMRTMLPEDVERCVAWSTLERLDVTYESPDPDAPSPGLLFRAELPSRSEKVYMLLVHRSTEDWHTPLRLLRELVELFAQLAAQDPDFDPPPPAFSFVVYSGVEPWQSTTELRDLFHLTDVTRPLLTPYLPNLRFQLLDLSSQPR